ncbi:MAG: hypothetical protein GXO40_02515 [Epsilonproteobacteria bacterium]|nr:hypothetical protein [Campylobacterota bacterium]
MNKLFVWLFPLFVFGMSGDYWWVEDTVFLKKDYPVEYKIYYNGEVYKLKFRWTLYKNDGLVMLYNFKNHPYQNILYKNTPLNGFKKYIAFVDSVKTPFFLVLFKDIKDDIAQLQLLIHNPERNIQIEMNEPKYGNRDWVASLPPMYQKDFEREIKPWK